MNLPLQRIIANRYSGRDIPIALVLPDGDRVPLSETPEVDVYARTWQGLKALASPELGALARAYVRNDIDFSGGARRILGIAESLVGSVTYRRDRFAARTRTWLSRRRGNRSLSGDGREFPATPSPRHVEGRLQSGGAIGDEEVHERAGRVLRPELLEAVALVRERGLAMAEAACEWGMRGVAVAPGDASQAALVKGLEVVPVDHVTRLRELAEGEIEPVPPTPDPAPHAFELLDGYMLDAIEQLDRPAFYALPGGGWRDLVTLMKAGLRAGRIHLQSLHTTVGLAVNENEPLLLRDFESLLERLAPRGAGYEHDDFARRFDIALDEPVNGLDPEGVHWIRGFFRELAEPNNRRGLVFNITGRLKAGVSLAQAKADLTPIYEPYWVSRLNPEDAALHYSMLEELNTRPRTTYVAALFTTTGCAYNYDYFTGKGADNAPLHALASGVDDRVVGELDSLPAPIAVHRVVAAADARNLSAVVLPHLSLQLLEVSGAPRGQGIAPVCEGMHKHPIHTILLCHAQKRIKMRLLRMHAAI